MDVLTADLEETMSNLKDTLFDIAYGGRVMGEEMTYKEFIEKHGNDRVKFSSYYKYRFTFSNDDGLSVSYGGIADEIYRYEVDANKEYTVSEIEPDTDYLKGVCLGDWRF